MILVRQNAVPAIVSRAAPEDWAAGAQRLSEDSLRTPALNDVVEKLTASGDYTVLLHKAWQQTLGEAAGQSGDQRRPGTVRSVPDRGHAGA